MTQCSLWLLSEHNLLHSGMSEVGERVPRTYIGRRPSPHMRSGRTKHIAYLTEILVMYQTGSFHHIGQLFLYVFVKLYAKPC